VFAFAGELLARGVTLEMAMLAGLLIALVTSSIVVLFT